MNRFTMPAKNAVRLMLGAGLISAGAGLAAANPCAPKMRDGMMQKNMMQKKEMMERPGMMKGGEDGAMTKDKGMMRAQNPPAMQKPDGMMKEDGMTKGATPCNPCAAKNPAAMKKSANPCAAKNPYAAKKAGGPCNPCSPKKKMKDGMTKGANPCNPCSPKKMKDKMGKQSALSPAQAKKMFAALMPTLRKAYKGGAHPLSDGRWANWKNFASAPYIGATHGGRWLVNHANATAAKVYGQYEKLKSMPAGGIVAKPSMVMKNGRAEPGPLFIMEKMVKGWNPATMDWRYAMIMPGGATFGMTKGANAKKVAFCHECHVGARDNDALLFLPENVRVR